jgi:hypothetical protein
MCTTGGDENGLSKATVSCARRGSSGTAASSNKVHPSKDESSTAIEDKNRIGASASVTLHHCCHAWQM